MKRLGLAFIFCFSIICCSTLLHLACSDGGSQNTGNTGNTDGTGGGGSGVLYANTIINDANGEIGKALAVFSSSIYLYSSNGYMYTLNWAGELYPMSPYYSGTSCSGSAYAYVSSGSPIYGKSVYYSLYLNKIYVPKTINSDGTAYYDKVNKITVNSFESSGTPVNSTTSIYGVELVETTRSAVGIPATITPPLSLVFK